MNIIQEMLLYVDKLSDYSTYWLLEKSISKRNLLENIFTILQKLEAMQKIFDVLIKAYFGAKHQVAADELNSITIEFLIKSDPSHLAAINKKILKLYDQLDLIDKSLVLGSAGFILTTLYVSIEVCLQQKSDVNTTLNSYCRFANCLNKFLTVKIVDNLIGEQLNDPLKIQNLISNNEQQASDEKSETDECTNRLIQFLKASNELKSIIALPTLKEKNEIDSEAKSTLQLLLNLISSYIYAKECWKKKYKIKINGFKQIKKVISNKRLTDEDKIDAMIDIATNRLQAQHLTAYRRHPYIHIFYLFISNIKNLSYNIATFDILSNALSRLNDKEFTSKLKSVDAIELTNLNDTDNHTIEFYLNKLLESIPNLKSARYSCLPKIHNITINFPLNNFSGQEKTIIVKLKKCFKNFNSSQDNFFDLEVTLNNIQKLAHLVAKQQIHQKFFKIKLCSPIYNFIVAIKNHDERYLDQENQDTLTQIRQSYC